MEKSTEKKPLWQRIAWLAGIWTISVLSLGLVSYLLRLFMNTCLLYTSPSPRD